MILETIFYWTGGIFIISLILLGLTYLWLYLFDKIWYNARISIKALYYDIAYNTKKGMPKEMEMKVGTSWFQKYRGKEYEWKIISIKDKLNEMEVKP